MAKVLRSEGIYVSVNPEVFVKGVLDVHTVFDKVSKDNVKVPQWKHMKIEDKGKTKQVMRIQDISMTKQEFVDHIQNQKQDFSEHVQRVKTQYSEIKRLKQNLSDKHVVLQMNFAKNYSCRSSEEIQSAYFNQTCVTLHSVVMYFKLNDKLTQKYRYCISYDVTQCQHCNCIYR